MTRQRLAPTSTLFTQTARITPGARVLLLYVDDPALARWAVTQAGMGGQVWALHASHHALQQLERLPGLRLDDAVYPDPVVHGPADVALLEIPKGREFVRAYLWTAAQALRPGGQLYLAGPNAGGAKSAIKDAADLLGSAPVLTYKSGHRIALGTRPDDLHVPPGWADPPPWEAQTRVFERPEGDYTIVTMPGVFSWEHLDEGTALLLDHLGAQPGQDVLDIGCGYGILGLAAARAGAQVTMVDDDLLAVRCARASAEINGLAARCTVLPSDITRAVEDQQFDLVVSNPPFHRHIEVTTTPGQRIVREGYERLRRNGRLRIVANSFLPYDRVMLEQFGSVETLADDGRFRVLEAVRRRGGAGA